MLLVLVTTKDVRGKTKVDSGASAPRAVQSDDDEDKSVGSDDEASV